MRRRWHLPLRFAMENDEVGGVRIAAGEAFLASYAAAHRDPRVYGATADASDLHWTVRVHLTFGYGTYHCLGAPSARLEAEIALPAIVARLPEMRLAVDAELGAVPSSISSGHARLPVVLRRGDRSVPRRRA